MKTISCRFFTVPVLLLLFVFAWVKEWWIVEHEDAFRGNRPEPIVIYGRAITQTELRPFFWSLLLNPLMMMFIQKPVSMPPAICHPRPGHCCYRCSCIPCGVGHHGTGYTVKVAIYCILGLVKGACGIQFPSPRWPWTLTLTRFWQPFDGTIQTGELPEKPESIDPKPCGTRKATTIIILIVTWARRVWLWNG